MAITPAYLFWLFMATLAYALAVSFINILAAHYQHSREMYDRVCEARLKRRKYLQDLEAKQDLVVATATDMNTPDSLTGQVVLN